MNSNLKDALAKLVLVGIFVAYLFRLTEMEAIYTVLFTAIVLFFEFIGRKYSENDLFYPKYILLILFYLYSFSGLSSVLNFGVDNQGTAIPGYVINDYFVACLIGVFGLCLGFALFRKKTTDSFETKKIDIDEKKIFKVLIFYVFIALLLNFNEIFKKYNFLSVESYLERALSYRLERRKSSSSGLYEVFLLDSPVLIINFICIYRFFKSKYKLIRFVYLIPFVACILVALLSGFRSTLLNVAIPFLFLFHYQYKRFVLSPSKVLMYTFFGFLGYTFINLMSILRVSSDPSVMINTAVDVLTANNSTFNSISKSGELTTSLNFMRLMLGLDNGEVPYTFGGSLLDEFLVFIPLQFYPGRPHSVSEQFVISFYPHIHDMGGGMGQFCLLEGYWSFGNFGVLFTSVAFAYLLAKFYYRIAPYLAMSPVFVLLYSQVFDKAVMSVVRGGYIGAIKGSLISGIIIILAIKLSKYIRK